ncbi:MAG: serine/threonine-protein kinase, partial [Planctomycetota bacterium]|nr:serine/threonine-protein kinase [Planctomycetota bacterium]
MFSTDSLPEQLGNFRIIEKTGQGRSGAIFLAEKIDTRQRVTLKILDPQCLLVSPDRFLQTLDALVSPEHPRILPILEAGQESSFSYLVSPLIGEGTNPPISLETRLRQGPLDIPTALEITCDLLQTLVDAHQNNHLHLGLSPDSILFDSSGIPFLSDFGLSSCFDRSVENSDDTSSESKQVSSYRAPEQRRGEPTDQRTDLYSLSVILYEMLTGYRPDLHYVPPSEILPGLGTYLDSFLEQGLQRDPEKRFQMASEMLAEIDRSLQEASTSSVIPQPVDHASSSLSETLECPFCARQSPARGDRCPFCGLSGIRQCPGCDGLNDFHAPTCAHCDQPLPKGTPLIHSIQKAENSYQSLTDETQEAQERIDSGIAAIDSYTSARSQGAFGRDIEERLESIEIHLAHLFQIRGEQFLSTGNIQEGILDLEESLRLAPSPAVDRILQAVWARIQNERKRGSRSSPSKAPGGTEDPIEKTTQTLFRDPWPQSRSSIVPSPSVAIPAPSRSRLTLLVLCLLVALGGVTFFYFDPETPSASQTFEKPPSPPLAPFQQALRLHRALVSQTGPAAPRALTPQITDLVLESIRSHRKKGNLDAVRTESQWLLSHDVRAVTEKLSLELAATGVLRALEFEKRGEMGAAARSLRCALQMDPKLRLDARCRP